MMSPLARISAWAPVGAWVALTTFALSTSDLGYFRPLSKDVPDPIAHMLLYLVLGLLVARALHAEGVSGRNAFLAGLLGCGALAVATEVIQSFVPKRNASVLDAIYDGVGAVMGLAIVEGLLRARVAGGPPSEAGDEEIQTSSL